MSGRIIDALKKGDEVELTVKGRTSGRESSRPVWFILKDKELLLLPVAGSMTQWYKNIVKNHQVTITIAGETYSGNAQPVRDKEGVSEVIELFRKKHGAGDVKKYYSRLDAAVRLKLSQ